MHTGCSCAFTGEAQYIHRPTLTCILLRHWLVGTLSRLGVFQTHAHWPCILHTSEIAWHIILQSRCWTQPCAHMDTRTTIHAVFMQQGGKVSHSGYEVQNTMMPSLPMRVIPDRVTGKNLCIAHVRLYFSQVQPLCRICIGLANLISTLQQHSPWNLQVAPRYYPARSLQLETHEPCVHG